MTGRRADILAWNRLGHALFAEHVDFDGPRRTAERPNLARLLFLDAHTRELYADWEAKAKGTVENLRMVAGRYPDDTLLTSLIGELTVRSEEFATMWTGHRVKPCAAARHEMWHPLVGTLTVTHQTLPLPQAEDQKLTLAIAEPGSPSQEAMALLAQSRAAPAAKRTDERRDGPEPRSAQRNG